MVDVRGRHGKLSCRKQWGRTGGEQARLPNHDSLLALNRVRGQVRHPPRLSNNHIIHTSVVYVGVKVWKTPGGTSFAGLVLPDWETGGQIGRASCRERV